MFLHMEDYSPQSPTQKVKILWSASIIFGPNTSIGEQEWKWIEAEFGSGVAGL